MEDRFQVGVISSTHGIRGEVKVFPTTDDVKRFRKNIQLILDTGNIQQPVRVENVKFFKQFVILKLEGFHSINDVEKYKGHSLYVTRDNAVELGEDEYFVADLLGMEVTEEDGTHLGVLKDVIETGANDVYVISLPDGGELLLPAIRDCILSVDVEGNRMKVHVMEGLRG
ncbi:MAG: ribosome maturation factor RimM [Lachnospiraceae bacterium]|nr:ribosome maturation factor RimM [Lachnospiraceae bacterium]